ncbi:hypothetical protein PCE1_004259 [Barthelona sp. PCE]
MFKSALIVFFLLSMALGHNYFDIIPKYMGTVFAGKEISFKGTCFRKVNVRLSSHGDVVFTSHKAKDLVCKEVYVVLTPFDYHLAWTQFHGKHTVDIDWKPNEYEAAKREGVRIFMVHEGFIDTVKDAFHLYKSLAKADPSELRTLQQSNLGFTYKVRDSPITPIPIDEIRSGDSVTFQKSNFEETMIAIGCQSRAGHSGIAVWNKDKTTLYILESTPELGYHKTEYNDWVRFHTNGERCHSSWCMASILHLKDELADVIERNIDTVWEHIDAHMGSEYTYFTNFFSLLDSSVNALPDPFYPEMLLFAFHMLNEKSPEVMEQYFLPGFRHRLGDESLKTFNDVLQVVINRGMTVEELWAIPERDEWLYNGKHATHCTSLVYKVWKAGGLFDYLGIDIETNEQHPRDMYEIDIYKKHQQVFGDYYLVLPTFSSVPPYSHMNEQCQLIKGKTHYPAMC